MKTLSALFISFLILLILTFACNKKEIQTPPLKASDIESSTVWQAKRILTSHPWMYQKLVFFYHPSTDSGRVMYERGAPNNTYPYDSYRFYYYKGGAYEEVDIYGNHTSGKWQVMDNGTIVKVTYNGNPTSSYHNVKLLDTSHYNFVYGVYTTRYAALIPATN